MTIETIENSAEHQRIMERIETLMECEPDTPEAEELDRLTTMVEQYEEIHFPIGKPSDEAARQFRREQEIDFQANGRN